MPLFVDPQDVILRMQLSADLTGIDEVIRSGIIGAQLHVERIIDGRLARQHHHGLYFLDSESFSGIAPSGAYRLEIPSGLVRQDTPQIVGVSTGTIDGPFTTYEAADLSLMKFDYARGYLYMDMTYGDNHVQVQCDTGYEDGTRPLPIDDLVAFDDRIPYVIGDQVVEGGVAYECIKDTPAQSPPQSPPIDASPPNAIYWTLAYVPQEPIPDAIYEAIISLVPMVFNANQTTNRSNEAQKQYQVLTDHANLLLQPWVRAKGFSFRTVFGNTA